MIDKKSPAKECIVVYTPTNNAYYKAVISWFWIEPTTLILSSLFAFEAGDYVLKTRSPETWHSPLKTKCMMNTTPTGIRVYLKKHSAWGDYFPITSI